MNEKFKNLKMDEGTTLIFRKDVEVNGLEAVYEKWNWEGIVAESLVFLSEEVTELTEEIFELVLSANGYFEDSSRLTLKTVGEFTFVNFNFKT